MLAALTVGCGQPAPSDAFPFFSNDGGRVRDQANILSPATERSLKAKLDKAEAQWGQQMAVVTVPSLEGYTIEDYSIGYARAWGLGDKDRNDGLMLLVAPNERKVRIEVGKGIERSFTDLYAKSVINMMLPYFRQGDFDAAVSTGVDELVIRMREFPSRPANDDEGANSRAHAA